ncbi:MAG: non-heme iron oxygenase ferredoxin subunit [Pseudomonadota bacterium]|nr:non-heme iron oxygenase ferredoxin subunit [Pseudomonadota bacterium]
MSADPAWQDVASLDDFAASDAIAVDVGTRQIAIYFVDGTVFATDNRCTHGEARLCDGFLEGHEIECPHHQGRFDIRTGAATGVPAKTALATYPAKLEGGRVLLQL